MKAAFDSFRNAPKKAVKVLFLLTDGKFDSSGYQVRGPGGKVLMGSQAVIHWLHENNGDKSVQVFPIIVGPAPSPNTEASMKLLAGENGGQYRHSSN